MAYMRGDYYFWADDSGLHLWAADGYDSWDETSWHREDDGEHYPVTPRHLKDGKVVASGVSIHQEIMDEYVMMRLAEMVQENLVDAAIDRATDLHGGNGGVRLLVQNADRLKAALSGLKLEPAPPFSGRYGPD